MVDEGMPIDASDGH